MPEGFLYLDSSALVKLVLPEAESGPLLALLEGWKKRVSSALAAVEVVRASSRASSHEIVHRRAQRVLEGIHLVPIDAEVLEAAARLEPPGLRTLDAIHLASALVLRPDLEGLVAYDVRLADAARDAGISVLAPV
ncbi:MAG: type II toxin-antitoxin system VapC family toxin [Acidobacteriota bacterium]